MIFAIGVNLPEVDGFQIVSPDSDQSLLDADVIVFYPQLWGLSLADTYKGKPRLSDYYSFLVQEKKIHWQTQMKAACDSGKSIFIFLPEKQHAWRFTGERQYSGTGRSRVSTNIVEPISNYDLLPIQFESLVAGEGKAMKLSSNAEVVASYWREFGAMSKYQTYFSLPKAQPLILTRTGDKMVGAVFGVRGRIVLLPNLEWEQEKFTIVNEEDEEEYWSPDAESFSVRLRNSLLAMDALLRGDSHKTPPPEWVNSAAFRLSAEAQIEAEILGISEQIEALTTAREAKRRELDHESSLRALLFEKGKRLEAAAREGLSVLGFDATQFKGGESEFDAVFVGPEGRFIGEVEGKDAKPVNIDKLAQLERNISEDFVRDDVEEAAKGVLFGNAFRLSPLEERSDFFTQKVMSGAKRTGIALVRTPDLFRVARYVRESGDSAFAASCRKAIVACAGNIVGFPAVPEESATKASHQDSTRSDIRNEEDPALRGKG